MSSLPLVLIGLYITAVVNLVLALVIFSRGYANPRNFIFGAFTLSAAAWAVSIVGFYAFPTFVVWANWVTYTHMFALLTSVFFMCFTFYFPQNLIKGKSWILLVPGVFTLVILYFVCFTDSIIGSIRGISYEIGPLYLVYAAALSAAFFTGYFALAKQYRNATSLIHKKQTLYVATSGIISPTLAIIPDLVLPYFGIFSYTWLGPPFTLIMVVALFIAMVRFQLFNIKVIATELFASLVVIVMLAQLFLAASYTEVAVTATVLIFVTLAAFLLIRSVYREVEQKEEIQRLYKELEVKNERLTELDKLKSQFLSIATHELRTPLTIVRNFMSLMLDGSYGKIPEAAAEGGRQVFDRVNDMARSVDTYLNVSRIEQGKIKYDFAAADITPLVKLAVDGLRANAEKKGLSLTLSVAHGAETLKANIDAPKITEVLINLIDNSIKYTPKGSVTVTLERVGGKARVTIKDTGVGMTQKTMDNLFKLFTPGEDSKKINPASTGVGLYISKAHVEAHKGSLVASSGGTQKGSQFTLEIPLS